jgi:hypothetical protein
MKRKSRIPFGDSSRVFLFAGKRQARSSAIFAGNVRHDQPTESYPGKNLSPSKKQEVNTKPLHHCNIVMYHTQLSRIVLTFYLSRDIFLKDGKNCHI